MKKNMETVFLALGTVNSIMVDDFNDDSLIKDAVARVQELHNRLSAFDENSEISAVNRAAGRNCIKVHQDTLFLLKDAKKYADLTAGAFNPAIRPLVQTWNVGNIKAKVPQPEEINRALRLINHSDILIDENNSQVMLKYPHMAIDLGAIAKGFACDEVKRILTENGVKNAIINLGGTVNVIGKPKTVGIQHPGKKIGISFGNLELTNKTAVTSGSYEKFFQKNDVCYHHILDSTSGYPANTDLKSVTLIGESALTMDALSTAIFVMGIEKGYQIIKKFNLEAIFVTNHDQILVTDHLRNSFHLPLSEKTEAII